MPDNWVDYRPQWHELAGMDEIKTHLHPYTAFDMPHLLLSSPQPGTGKTSLAYALAIRLDIPLHLFNASSKRTRGIEFIEEDVGPLARCGREMIILWDEADQLTPAAQMALKGVMENCGAIFILTTNNVAKVDKPIQSRCLVFNFKPFRKDIAKEWLETLASHNGEVVYDLPSGTLDKIADAHHGDMRAMINSLQTVITLKGEEDRTKFLLSLYSIDFDVKLFYEYINDLDWFAFEMMHTAGDIRNTLKVITDYAIENIKTNSRDSKKADVLHHIANAYRDFYLGMPEKVVVAAFCQNMVQSAPLYP
jgi:replication factor C small subunit